MVNLCPNHYYKMGINSCPECKYIKAYIKVYMIACLGLIDLQAETQHQIQISYLHQADVMFICKYAGDIYISLYFSIFLNISQYIAIFSGELITLEKTPHTRVVPMISNIEHTQKIAEANKYQILKCIIKLDKQAKLQIDTHYISIKNHT